MLWLSQGVGTRSSLVEPSLVESTSFRAPPAAGWLAPADWLALPEEAPLSAGCLLPPPQPASITASMETDNSIASARDNFFFINIAPFSVLIQRHAGCIEIPNLRLLFLSQTASKPHAARLCGFKSNCTKKAATSSGFFPFYHNQAKLAILNPQKESPTFCHSFQQVKNGFQYYCEICRFNVLGS